MDRRWIVAALCAACTTLPAAAQPGAGSSNGATQPAPATADRPDARPGPGWGYGMRGRGMMGGPGMGGGWGMGPGMMMGPGMGPGMMMGGMPPAVMADLDLTEAQRSRIGEIQREMRQQHWAQMGAVHEQQYRLEELQASGSATPEQIDKAYAEAAQAHKQMFESAREARARIVAVLTPEQRQRLSSRWGWNGTGPG